MTPPREPAASPDSNVLCALVCLALVAVTLAVYWPVRSCDFVNYDDDAYVTANAAVLEGLSGETLAWAFRTDTTVASNWHPVTMLSHLADVSLFGLDPAGHHLTSLLWHALNVVLLLLLLRSATGSLWCSACVAALFALHPLNVQTVAWISERKSVVSTFFWLAALWTYMGYARSGARSRLIATGALLTLGLMAKSMLVTLPCVLLLLDVWPLDRVARLGWRRLVLEKLPLFAIVGVASWITLVAQESSDAMLANIPMGYRFANATGGYLEYLGKLAWPHPLSIFYPHPGSEMTSGQLGFAAISAAAVIGVSLTAYRWRQRAPWALFGWLWFVGTLVPVIGLVQVGDQAIADRYTYVPAIGLFVIVAWGARAFCGQRARARVVLSVAVAVWLSLLAVRTRAELAPWKNSEALFRHALVENDRNYLAHTNLAAALYDQGLKQEAVEHLTLAVEYDSGYALALANLGTLYAEGGQLEDAERMLSVAAYMLPETARAHNALGAVSMQLGKLDQAESEFLRALEIDPDYELTKANLARLAGLRP
jgi:hypothetical protein